MTFEVILHLMKNLFLHNVDILEIFLKDLALNKNKSQKTTILKFKMTLCDFEVIPYLIKKEAYS